MAHRPSYIWLIALLVQCCCQAGWGQDRSNPFEITTRLPEVMATPGSVAERGDYSPFDVRQGGAGSDLALHPSRLTPASAPNGRQGSPLVIHSADPNRGEGIILAIQLILLVALASLWVLFGNLLQQCIRGTLNESLMNQIYTHRSGGEQTALWICYLFFFLAAGFFLYLFAAYHDVGLNLNIWASWLTYALFVAGVLGLKQWIIHGLGRLFPIRKETSRYAFVLMVFSVLIGVLLVPINLGASYAPEDYRSYFLYGGLGVIALIYLLHMMRGLVVAGNLVSSRPLHLVLYICAIEIAPLLLIYRYLSNVLEHA